MPEKQKILKTSFEKNRKWSILNISSHDMPNGVTVAQLILVQFVEVRILIGQPLFSLEVLLNR